MLPIIEEPKITKKANSSVLPQAQVIMPEKNTTVSMNTYEKQLDDDLQMLKDSFAGKKKKTSKGPVLTNIKKQQKIDKNKINKTMMPAKVA